MRVSEPRIVYTPRPEATVEGEISALAGVYRFILFESRASKEEGGPAITALDDTRGESKHDSRTDKAIIPE